MSSFKGWFCILITMDKDVMSIPVQIYGFLGEEGEERTRE